MKQKTFLLLVLLGMILFVMTLGGCATGKQGCKPERPQRQIKFKGFLSPASMQVKIIQVTMVGKGKANITGVKMGTSDSVYLHYGWSPGNRNRNLRPGVFVTVHYDSSVPCTPGQYLSAIIKLNT